MLPEFLFISWLNGVRIRVMHGNDDAVFFSDVKNGICADADQPLSRR
ncbi:hypothetical protein ATN83_3988 [Raoultella ornithinolytica]|nr:hypothetical protein ATN83_3988 [Raoultella ornithinolytica]